MTSLERGRELEGRVADYFRSHGYDVETNVIIEGRSGGLHEVDVVAQKYDGLTEYSVAVECKAYGQPIEKDVVTKLAFIAADLRINKSIIVSTGGWTSGVGRAAAQLGVDLWGPEELRLRLAEESPVVPDSGSVAGWLPKADARQVDRVLRRSVNRRFGRRTEQMVWVELFWLPTYLLELTVASEQKSRKLEMTESRVRNLYDGLSARYLGPAPDATPEEVGTGGIQLRPLVPAPKLVATLRKSMDRYREVSSVAALDRHSSSLAALGVPTPCVSVNVESAHQVAFPYFVCALRSAHGQRIAAVHGLSGKLDVTVSSLLTTHASHVVKAVEG